MAQGKKNNNAQFCIALAPADSGKLQITTMFTFVTGRRNPDQPAEDALDAYLDVAVLDPASVSYGDAFEFPSDKSALCSVNIDFTLTSQLHNGLKNLGNSCFLNAPLQAVVHVPAVHSLLTAYASECSLKFCVTKELKNLATQLDGEGGVILPKQFFNQLSCGYYSCRQDKYIVKKPGALGTGVFQRLQCDAHELLVGLLGCMDVDKSDSALLKLFQGRTCTTRTCSTCNQEERKEDDYKRALGDAGSPCSCAYPWSSPPIPPR